MTRRDFNRIGSTGICASRLPGQSVKPPNIVLILADDLGYGDVGCYNPSATATPNIDQLARDGMRFTNAITAAPICTASRSSLLTGRQIQHSGLDEIDWVLQPGTNVCLPLNFLTIAEILKLAGYRTGCFGKWHLGENAKALPLARGFDDFAGIPYSNNQGSNEHPNPLYWNNDIVIPNIQDWTARPALMEIFTRAGTRFIQDNTGKPFFLYLPFTAPHSPFEPGIAFKDASGQGPREDCITELDFRVGQILDTLSAAGLSENTIVIFTSDNGAPKDNGSNGPFKGFKETPYPGAFMTPLIISRPGTVPCNTTCTQVVSLLDLIPTLLGFAGITTPLQVFDGMQIQPLLKQQELPANDPLNNRFIPLFFAKYLRAVRTSRFVLQLGDELDWFKLPQLYTAEDTGQVYDIAAQHKKGVIAILQQAENLLYTYPQIIIALNVDDLRALRARFEQSFT